MTFEEDVLRLYEEGWPDAHIAEELHAKLATVRRVIREADDYPEAESARESEAGRSDALTPRIETAEIVSTKTAVPTIWIPPIPSIPQPRAGERDSLRSLLRYYEDHQTERNWSSLWQMVRWLWDEACRVPGLNQSVAGLREQLSIEQGKVGAWVRWHDNRVRTETERQVSEHKRQLDSSYQALIEQHRAEARRWSAIAVSAATKAEVYRNGLDRSARDLTESRRRLNELWRAYDVLHADRDALLRAILEGEGFEPDCRGIEALINRWSTLGMEQLRRDVEARIRGRFREPVRLRQDGRLLS